MKSTATHVRKEGTKVGQVPAHDAALTPPWKQAPRPRCVLDLREVQTPGGETEVRKCLQRWGWGASGPVARRGVLPAGRWPAQRGSPQSQRAARFRVAAFRGRGSPRAHWGPGERGRRRQPAGPRRGATGGLQPGGGWGPCRRRVPLGSRSGVSELLSGSAPYKALESPASPGRASPPGAPSRLCRALQRRCGQCRGAAGRSCGLGRRVGKGVQGAFPPGGLSAPSRRARLSSNCGLPGSLRARCPALLFCGERGCPFSLP